MNRAAALDRLAYASLRGREYLLSVGEVAAIFEVSPRTVRVWCEHGHLDYLRTLGNHRRITSRSVVSWLAYRGVKLPEVA